MSVTLPRSQPAGPAGTARRYYSARLIALLALALLLAACGAAATPTVTPIPATPTPTPLSEPLPTVATQPPFGVSDRPFKLMILTPSARENALSDLEAFLTGRTGQAFAVQTSETGADVLDALCSDVPTAAWVDGLTLLIALDRGCAEPALQIRRGRGNAASNGVRADLIAGVEARSMRRQRGAQRPVACEQIDVGKGRRLVRDVFHVVAFHVVAHDATPRCHASTALGMTALPPCGRTPIGL